MAGKAITTNPLKGLSPAQAWITLASVTMIRKRMGDALAAIRNGGSHRHAAMAVGFTKSEFDYALKLARTGDPNWHEFFLEYSHAKSVVMTSIAKVQLDRALSDDGTIADRKFALEIADPEFYREPEQAVKSHGTFNAGNVTFEIKDAWKSSSAPVDDDSSDIQDAEVVNG